MNSDRPKTWEMHAHASFSWREPYAGELARFSVEGMEPEAFPCPAVLAFTGTEGTHVHLYREETFTPGTDRHNSLDATTLEDIPHDDAGDATATLARFLQGLDAEEMPPSLPPMLVTESPRRQIAANHLELPCYHACPTLGCHWTVPRETALTVYYAGLEIGSRLYEEEAGREVTRFAQRFVALGYYSEHELSWLIDLYELAPESQVLHVCKVRSAVRDARNWENFLKQYDEGVKQSFLVLGYHRGRDVKFAYEHFKDAPQTEAVEP